MRRNDDSFFIFLFDAKKKIKIIMQSVKRYDRSLESAYTGLQMEKRKLISKQLNWSAVPLYFLPLSWERKKLL